MRFGTVLAAVASLVGVSSALDVQLNGINYDLAQGPDWDPKKCKDATTIQADLEVLSKITTKVRTYALAGCDVSAVLTSAKKLKMSVWLGVWVAADESVYKKELDALDKLLEAGLIDDNVVGFNVGSEAVYRGDITAEQAVQYVTDFKAKLKKKDLSTPVSITDVADVLVMYPSMIEASDVVTANQFPFWEKQQVSGAAKQFKKRFQGLLAAAGSKKVIITETGWPSAGTSKNGSVASGPNAAKYLNDFVSLAKTQKWDYYYFAAFDSAYKALQENDTTTVEAHFGIFDESRVMKPEIAALKVSAPESAESATSSTAGSGTSSGKDSDVTTPSTSSSSTKSDGSSTKVTPKDGKSKDVQKQSSSGTGKTKTSNGVVSSISLAVVSGLLGVVYFAL